MAHRDSVYRLQNLIELDDTYVGGKRPGKRGRGAAGKKSVLVAVEKTFLIATLREGRLFVLTLFMP
jgi:hypothetical protein